MEVVTMQNENEQKNSLVRQEKGELLNKQGLVSHSVVRNLILEAMEGMKKAYVPYSHFHVGAALLTSKQVIYRGCNIENASYGSSICAERTAFCKAVSDGARDFAAIAIVGGKEGIVTDYCPPCGICRQVMREFVNPKHFLVILAKNEDDYLLYFLEEILPMGFGPENLSMQ
jgi:cytidine deaminase